MTTITLSYSELDDMLFRASKMGAMQALQETGLLKSTLKRAEVEKLYGRRMYEKSLLFVRWQKKGGSVICQRVDFEKFITKFNEEQKELKTQN